ncbi:MAG TPA: hypothetical protein PLV45_10800 [bacterium]|nr:hypothetical protein [bacterium]
MMKRTALCLGLLLFGGSMIPVVFAWDFDEDRIPNGTVFSCDTCHGNTTHQLNPFGTAYNAAGRTWTAGLAQADSDGDGYTNGQELLDPDGSWNTGEPDPGNPGDVTNPGNASSFPTDPTATPNATATPVPTGTPAPTGTPGNTPTPSATPADCPGTGVTIEMPGDMFSPGTPCYCHISVCNSGSSALDGYPLLVLLDVYGQYFFAPTFEQDLAFYDQTYPPGRSTVVVLPEFIWPSGAGSADNIIWYAALTDPSITSLVGTMDTMAFGWSE